MEFKIKQLSGIDGNCPKWAGASKVYSKAYRLMQQYGADLNLIKALNNGDEETIKSILMYNYN